MHSFKVKNIYYSKDDADHKWYDGATRISNRDGKALYLIQKKWNKRLKASFWSTVDPGLVNDILDNPKFEDLFRESSDHTEQHYKVRSVMWALGMKRPPLEPWE